jgi:hypothetical protein
MMLLVVPAALIGVWLVHSKRAAPRVNKKALP